MILVFTMYASFVAFIYAVVRRFTRSSHDSKPLVQVVVLGDVGHSPRMQYHALSLANTGRVSVEIVGFRGSPALESVVEHADIKIRYIRQLSIPASWRVPFVVYAVGRVVFESVQLFCVLIFSARRAEFVLVQTPPAAPSIFICLLVRALRGTKVVLDFHNITFMHLESKVGSGLLVMMVRWYEKCVARFASASLCVTRAMREFLISEFSLKNVTTLYDRPGSQFRGRTATKPLLHLSLPEFDYLLISSTSWTADEKFSLLLEALPGYSKGLASKKALLFITGKGEGRARFVSDFKKLNLSNVELRAEWVAAADYPLLLGLADVGVCLHSSTSKLDLPMKVVDMLGSELPVVALAYDVLAEFDVEGKAEGNNILKFNTGVELAECLLKLTVEDSEGSLRRAGQKFAANWRKSSWDSEWTRVAWPALERILPRQSRQARRRVG